MSAKVYYFPHPFTQERREESIEPGVSIASLVQKARSDIPHGLMVRTFVNGNLITADKRQKTIVQDDDEIIVRIVPADLGGTDRQNAAGTKAITGAATAILGTILLVTAAVAWWVAVPIMVAGVLIASVGAGLTEAGIIGTYADEQTAKTHPSLHGASNGSNPNGKVPLILGTHLYTPGYLSPSYTEIAGTDGIDQYLHMSYILGYGPLKVSNIKLGDTLIASNSANVTNGMITCDGVLPGCELEIRQDTVNGTGLSLYPKVVKEQTFQQVLKRYHVLESNKELSGVTLTVDATARTITRSTGNWTDSDNDVQVGDYIAFYGFSNSGNQKAQIVTGITSTVIYCNQALGLVNESKTGVYANVWPANIQTTGKHTTQISVTITFTKLVKFSGDNKLNATVTVVPYYRLKVDSGQTPNAWQILGTFDNGTNIITRNKSENMRFTASTGTLTSGEYEVMLQRQTADPTDSNIQDTVYWTALRSFTGTDIMPVNTRKQVCILGVKIKSSEAVANCISQLNCMVTADYSYITAKDTSHDWASIISSDSSNASLAFVHAIMGKGNPRPRTTDKMGWDSIYSLARWCDTLKGTGSNQYRVEVNGIITSSMKLSEFIQGILAPARAALTMSEGKYGVVLDQAQTIVKQHIGPHNSWGFSGTKSYAEPIHGYRVKFVNKAEQYVTDERIVLDDRYKYDTEQDGVLRDCWGNNRTSDSNYIEATKFESIEAAYDTNPAQVFGWGRYLLAVRRLRPELFTVNMDAENLAVQRGELVKVQHPAPLWGLHDGRLTGLTLDESGNITGLTTDNLLTMETGKAYAVRIRTSTGTSVYRTVTTVEGETHNLNLSSLIPSSSDMPAEGDWFGFGIAGLETVDCIVAGVDLNADLSAKLTLFEAAPGVHVADSGTIPAFNSKVSFGPKASMPGTSTPIFPAEADPIPYPSPKTLSALTDIVDFDGQYGIYTNFTYQGNYATQVWTRIQTKRYPDVANSTALAALTGMIAGDTVYKTDTRTWYKYTTAWVIDGQLSPTDIPALAAHYLGRYNAAHPASYKPGDWWLVYDTDDDPIQRGVWYSNAGTPTRISAVSGETGYTTDSTLLAKLPSALGDVGWAVKNGFGVATNYGVAVFYESLAVVTEFVQNLYVKHLDGADGTFTGTLVANVIQSGSAIYSADGHIAIKGDSTSNIVGEGICFTNYNQKTTTWEYSSSNVRYNENLYSSETDYSGIKRTLRRFGDTAAMPSEILNVSSSSCYLKYGILEESEWYMPIYISMYNYTSLNIREITLHAQSPSTYAADIILHSDSGRGYIKLLTSANNFIYFEDVLYSSKITATTTDWTFWFQVKYNECGLIAYGNSDHADIWAYICLGYTITLTRLCGTSTFIQKTTDSRQIFVKTNDTNNPMTFYKLQLR